MMSGKITEGSYPGDKGSGGIQKNSGEEPKRRAINEEEKRTGNIHYISNTYHMSIKESNQFEGKFGKERNHVSEKCHCPQVIVTEELDEEEVEVTITPNFVKNHREALKARLAELEYRKKLEKLKARLTYDEGGPEGTPKEPGYGEELWDKILKMMEEQKTPQIQKEKNKDTAKSGGGWAMEMTRC
ncbi:hypothetical protein E3N88_18349 [Mikania micrantha]|uniref:Uncharacterized protein n=1 Tax=Mikania micrantha TaxID=192012 RepID=A0A5N6NWA1_9ASTR|nr:hypothetical protein E3N88_18349 [Mikania micrantha]